MVLQELMNQINLTYHYNPSLAKWKIYLEDRFMGIIQLMAIPVVLLDHREYAFPCHFYFQLAIDEKEFGFGANIEQVFETINQRVMLLKMNSLI